MSDSTGELQGGDPQGSVSEEAVAPALVPPTTGQVLGAAFAQQFSQNTTVAIARDAARRTVAGQTQSPLNSLGLPSLIDPNAPDPRTGELPPAPEPSTPKDELNKQYGIPGVLSFDQDMSASMAASIQQHKIAEIQRDDILQRNVSTIATGGLARFLAGGAAGLLDPLNLAAAFVPGVPEARVAGMLGDAAVGPGGRAAVRAITGATQGAAGMAALQPLAYGIAQAQHDDWDMGAALSQIAFGGLIGGALHPGLGVIEDARELPDWAKAVASAPRDLQETMTKGAIAAVAEDQPRPIDQIIGIHNDLQDMQAELQALQRGELPPPAEGTTRFYHGGVEPDGGPRWVTQYQDYAQGYANKTLGAQVYYTDIANDHPDLAKTYEDEGTGLTAPFANFEAPADIAATLKPVDDPAYRAARIADIQQKMASAAERAQAIADAQTRPITADDTPAQRQIAQRAATAPEITGDPVKDTAAVQAYDADFRQYVQQEKAAGRWGAAEDAALARIDEQQALGEGDAKAFAEAASCLARNASSAATSIAAGAVQAEPAQGRNSFTLPEEGLITDPNSKAYSNMKQRINDALALRQDALGSASKYANDLSPSGRSMYANAQNQIADFTDLVTRMRPFLTRADAADLDAVMSKTSKVNAVEHDTSVKYYPADFKTGGDHA